MTNAQVVFVNGSREEFLTLLAEAVKYAQSVKPDELETVSKEEAAAMLNRSTRYITRHLKPTVQGKGRDKNRYLKTAVLNLK